jgi:hypothetical protein
LSYGNNCFKKYGFNSFGLRFLKVIILFVQSVKEILFEALPSACGRSRADEVSVQSCVLKVVIGLLKTENFPTSSVLQLEDIRTSGDFFY